MSIIGTPTPYFPLARLGPFGPFVALSAFVLSGFMDVLRWLCPCKRASHHVLYYDKLRFLGLPNSLSFGIPLISQRCVCVNSFCCCTYLWFKFVVVGRKVYQKGGKFYLFVCVLLLGLMSGNMLDNCCWRLNFDLSCDVCVCVGILMYKNDDR